MSDKLLDVFESNEQEILCGRVLIPKTEADRSWNDACARAERIAARRDAKTAERIKELEQWVNNNGPLYIREDVHEERVKELKVKIVELVARIKRNDDRVARLLASYESEYH